MQRPGRDRRVRAYERSRQLFDKGTRLLRAGFDGFWLGVLDADQLDEIDERYYRNQAIYQDPGFNQSGLQPWERDAVDRSFRHCRRIAVLGAGGGRELVALEAEGFEVAGFECNPLLAEQGNALLASLGCTSRIAAMPRDVWSPGDERYDGVIVGWGTYMLIDSRQARIDLLRSVRSCLPAGGPVLVSFFARTDERRYFRVVHGVASALRRLRRRRPIELGVTLNPNRVQYLSLDEVAGELQAGGFASDVLAAEGYGNAVGLAAEPVRPSDTNGGRG